MNQYGFTALSIEPLAMEDLPEAEDLFNTYSFKDFQLKQLGIPKHKMAGFLKRSLVGKGVFNAILREEGRLVGLVSAKFLPWMSQLMGAKMYSMQHFVTAGKRAGFYQTMLQYVMDQIPDMDFLDCRVASGDINAIQALENSGFRFVGNEVYMVRSLRDSPAHYQNACPDCVPCNEELKPEVMKLVEETHFHNRYMYDPQVSAKDAADIYSKYLAGFAFTPDYHSLIKVSGGVVQGFIFYKFNSALSQMVGGSHYASLDFIGVRQDRQNRGLGEKLNQAALYDLTADHTSHVVCRTFGSNYPAMRILQKVGFKITSSDLHFHMWLRPRAQAKHGIHSAGEPFVAPSAVG